MKRLIPSVVFGLALLLLPGLARAQQGTVTGTITEAETGNPLPGATVQVQAEGTGTASGSDGQYRIPGVPAGEQTIRVTFVGYQAQERSVNVPDGGTVRVNFQLQAGQAELDEVVVTGVSQGTETAKLGFSVEKVDGEDLNRVPSTDPANALRGRISGAEIVRPSGEPGSSPNIRLRGTTTLQGSQSPLIVVDGAITQGSLEDIDMQNVESIEVIKGAAAASLYGSLAANGVVQIITKQGSGDVGDTRVTVRSELGTNQLANKVPTADHHRRQGAYRPLASESSTCDFNPCGANPLAEDGVIDNDYQGDTFDNQERLFGGNTFSTNYVELASTQENLRYTLSFENLQQGGIVKEVDNYTRRNFRVNLGNDIREWATVQLSGLYSRRNGPDVTEQGQGGNPFYSTLIAPDDLNLSAPPPDSANIDAKYNPFTNSGNAGNPLYELATNNDELDEERLFGNVRLNLEPTDWLTVNGQFSYDREENDFNTFTAAGTQPASPTGTPSTGSIFESDGFERLYIAEGSFTLEEEVANLRAQFTGRYNYENREGRNISSFGENFQARGVPQFGNTDPENLSVNSSEFTVKAENQIGNLVLDYDDTYILDGVLRREGVSLFGAKDRYKTYFRVAGTYRLTQDLDIPSVGQLKLRGSYGTSGQRPPFSAQYETFNVTSAGINKQQLGNEDLQPSTVFETAVGIDVAFLERFNFSGTFSDQSAEDQVLSVPLSSALGFTSQFQNAGTVESTTWEFSLGGRAYQGDSFTADFNLTWDRTRQEVTELNRSTFIRSAGSAASIYRIGEGISLGSIFTNKIARSVDQVNFDENGEVIGRQGPDGNALTEDDLTINDQGFVIVDGTQYTSNEAPVFIREDNGNKKTLKTGNAIPDFSMGLSTTLSYDNFTLYALADWQQGGDVYNYTRQLLTFNEQSALVDQADRPEGQRHTFGYFESGVYNTSNPSAFWVEDGSYLKIREISLSYRIGTGLLQRAGIGNVLQGAEISLSGRNLFTFTDYTGYDPEVSVQGGDNQPTNFRVDDYAYPNFRTYTAQVELTF
ncbi:SusC/RagA family TonB-linked outer membrane protein [Salinibacter grassmerensis]|uniref:SusC/RagA family TonB-linked outer membrane protein n=1 Tax=Salinibacter grassmerensis TaxID=3040353 RepID=UPI0021E85813|nr:SusC/RagA family TonB-linked outer membrane protein [Salinibacter grassmerensis]